MNLLPLYRLRIMIPVLVVSITLMIELFQTIDRVADQEAQYLHVSQNAMELRISLLQNILSELVPKGDIEKAQRRLDYTALDHQLGTMLLTDEEHKVLFSNRREWLSSPAPSVCRYDKTIAETGRATRQRQLLNLPGRIHGYYPVALATGSTELRPQRYGTLYVEYDYSAPLAQARQEAFRDAARQAALFISFALILSALLHLLITRNIERLLSVVKDVTGGNMGARARISGKGEIAQLAQAFDGMTEQLAREQEALHEQALELEAEVAERQAAQETLEEQAVILSNSESRYRLLVENSPLCIHEIGMDGRISSMNRAGLVMMGVEDECCVQGLLYLDAVCEADREHIGELLAQAYAGETSNFEFMASGPDRLIFKSCFVPIKSQHDRVEKLMGITEDITEQKRAEEALLLQAAELEAEVAERKIAQREIEQLNEKLEQRVEDRTTKLKETINELESFSYSVSHDLRAPLRSIDGFSQVLLEDYPEKLDEQGKDYLNRVRAASQRMAGLIDDMQKLSRVTRSEMEREPVDLSALARSVAEELRQSGPGG